ncbi:MAG: flavin reductase [Rhodospirillales bacterium]|nr:flavin reductase [Rhodospirillales bacterium]
MFRRRCCDQVYTQVRPQLLGKDGKGLAFTLFKPTKLEEGKPSVQSFKKGPDRPPVQDAAIGTVGCAVKTVVEEGNHHIVIGKVIKAHLLKPIEGRLGAAILEMKDLGDMVFHRG